MDSKIQSHFRRVDPILYKLLRRVGESKIHLSPQRPAEYFSALCANIISQQLSTKVADVFWLRFEKLLLPKAISPKLVLALPDATLRSIGISTSKVSYLKSLADYFLDPRNDFNNFSNLTDDVLIGELTKIKGIGRWTAEMFCMFTLGRPDLFSAGDLGLKNAISRHYKKPPDPNIWSPFRTYACLILWQSLEQ